MGFYSSIHFRLTGTGPGQLRGDEVAKLANLIASLELTRSRARCFIPNEAVDLWYGPRYDSDIDEISEQYCPNPKLDRMFSYRDRYPVDLRIKACDAADVAAQLVSSEENIYRGHVSFGTLCDELRQRLDFPAPENERYFRPGHLSLSIDPWAVVNELGNDKVVLGFLDLSFSGSGYFYPHQAKNYIDVLTEYAGIQELTDFIRVLWPQEPIEPPEELVELRRDWMKANWIDPLDSPLGWNWMGYDDV